MTSPRRTVASTSLTPPSTGQTYVDMLAEHGLREMTAHGERNPRGSGASPPPSGSFAAWFAEVRVDVDLGLLRVARLVSAVDAGRILNQKLARSQIIGGAVMGIGMTMLKETVFDPETGRVTNATFGDHLIPATQTCPTSTWSSSARRTGTAARDQGRRRDGVVGVSAASANAAYHATGRRIRSLPITVEQLL
jgi:xanthine dehydrogenase YagR molybdenum-binding subunit